MALAKSWLKRRRWAWLVAITLTLAGAAPAAAEEPIELSVPLHDGQFYTPRDFCEECNRKLGTIYPLEYISDRRIELTRLERAALVLADQAGLVDVTITADRLIITVPDGEDDEVRRRRRRQLERLLHLPLTDWPEDKGLHLPGGFDPHRRTLLLIHGLEAEATDLERFAAACEHADVQMLSFDYPNDGPIAWSGDRLRADLAGVAKKQPRLRLAIVGHSMGGLVARHALEAADTPPPCVSKLFMLGTPNHGSRLAGGQAALELVLTLRGLRLPGADLLKDGLGEAAVDLRPHSKFLTALNARRRPVSPPYYHAIGRRSFLTEPQRAALAEELPQLLARKKAPADLRAAVAGALESDELRDGRGDGVVSVASARLGDVEERLFDLNHSQLLSLPGEVVEDAEVFRWIMRVVGWESSDE